jgi:acyl-CoA thioester hydrolase
MPEPTPVRVPIDIRWRDLDPLGHINNAVYLTYFEIARVHYAQALLPGAQPVDARTPIPRDFQFLVAEISCRYRSPAMMGDRLEIAIHVSRVGRKSFDFEYRLIDANTGRLVADGRSTQVWFEYSAGESRPVPEEMIRRIEAFQRAALERT